MFSLREPRYEWGTYELRESALQMYVIAFGEPQMRKGHMRMMRHPPTLKLRKGKHANLDFRYPVLSGTGDDSNYSQWSKLYLHIFGL